VDATTCEATLSWFGLDHAPPDLGEILSFKAVLAGFTSSVSVLTIYEATTAYAEVQVTLTQKTYSVAIQVFGLLPGKDCTGVVLSILNDKSYTYPTQTVNTATCEVTMTWTGLTHVPDNELLTFGASLAGFTSNSPTLNVVEQTTAYAQVKVVLSPKIYSVPIRILGLSPRDCTGVVLNIASGYTFPATMLNVTSCVAVLTWSGYDHAPSQSEQIVVSSVLAGFDSD